jgi:magnesium-transporting ATPase (P-type)
LAFIPTGLPVAVTLSLLLIARKTAKHRILVKNLSTIETLSCVNVIASDKTGTLTRKLNNLNYLLNIFPQRIDYLRANVIQIKIRENQTKNLGKPNKKSAKSKQKNN